MIKYEELIKVLKYNPETGHFIWKKSSSNRVKDGSRAGTMKGNRYIYIQINGKKYTLHRLAFLYMTRSFPKDQADHINRIKNDNRWCNLRECTRSQNIINTHIRKDNTSDYKGVHWRKDRNKWRAQILKIGWSKTFICKHDAARVYNAKAKEQWGEFAYQNKIKGEDNDKYNIQTFATHTHKLA